MGPTTATAQAQPQTSTARASNIDASLLGSAPLPVVDVSQSAPPDAGAPQTAGFNGLNIPLLLKTQLLNASARAQAASTNDTCLPPGTQLSNSSVGTAGVQLLPGAALGNDVVDVGAISSNSATGLVHAAGANDTRAVQSVSSSKLSTISLFGTNVVITVSGTPTLTATATGNAATSGVDYNGDSVVVSIKVGNQPAYTVPAVSSTNIPLDLRFLGNGLLANIGLDFGNFTKNVNADGTSASGTGAVVSLNVTADLYTLGVPTSLADVDLDVGRLNATATAPVGGVQCATPQPSAAPVITTPPDGSVTNNPMPPIGGTGMAGATVTVVEGANTVCTAVVDAGGAWS